MRGKKIMKKLADTIHDIARVEDVKQYWTSKDQMMPDLFSNIHWEAIGKAMSQSPRSEISKEILGQCPVGRQVERPTVQHYCRYPKNQKAGSKPNNNSDHWHLGQSHAEIPAEIPGWLHM